MQGRSSRQGEEEEEGHLETTPVHHSSGQSAEHQLPQNLQSRQETVVGGLEEEWRVSDKHGQKITFSTQCVYFNILLEERI